MLLFYINNFDIIWIGQNVAMGEAANDSKTNSQMPFPVRWGKCSGPLVLPS